MNEDIPNPNKFKNPIRDIDIDEEISDPLLISKNVYDPLRIDKPRESPFFKGFDEDDIRIGDSDLFPGVSGTYGGSLLGPNHPMFGPNINNPYSNYDIKKKNPPKGIRFDPPGPFTPISNHKFGPDPDHDLPPNFGNMYI